MADRRNVMFYKPVGPSFLPGMILIMDEVTVDDGAVVTISFPAKTIQMVMAITSGTGVATAKSVTSNIGTVTLTATGNGTISYIIVASETETVDDLDILTEATYTITPKP